MKALIIQNPKSGRSSEFDESVLDIFKKAKINIDIKKTKAVGDGITLAKNAIGKYEIVIAAGGDGTVNEVINGIAEKKVKLGILPLGTENSISKELGIPQNLKKAAEIIINNKSIKFDLGSANGRYFALVAGVGFDAAVAADVNPHLKKLLHGGEYFLAAFEEIFKYEKHKMIVKIDDKEELEGYFAIVGNVKYYGMGLQMTPEADPTSGKLDLVLFKKENMFELLKSGIRALLHNIDKSKDVEYRKFEKVVIDSEGDLLVHADCELAGKTPVTFKVHKNAIEVFYKELQ
jgi:diacylglycerol kinase (ATP)|tara:strand:+ start:6756 stop:7625 length:870 start_codon:yes stop_codon:yes gene_type:complete